MGEVSRPENPPSSRGRSVPEWFTRDKIGIFLHWGPYSVPSYARIVKGGIYGEAGHACWYQAMLDDYRGVRFNDTQKKRHELFVRKHREDLHNFHQRMFGGAVSYEEVATRFHAELFDPAEWAALFRKAGARWAILTSKFHDGFCMWPSRFSPHWNSAVTGPRRDLLGAFSQAMRDAGLRAGFYYSLLEHNHPLYQADTTVAEYVQNHFHPQFKEVVSEYLPSFIYLDGEWDYPESVWRTPELMDWLYAESGVRDEVVVNDRWGAGSRGRRGDVYSSEIGSRHDRQSEGGFAHPWIEDRPIGDWSHNRTLKVEDHLSERGMIHLLVETVANGGNIHFAVSPAADGTIPPLHEERLLQLGDWLSVNGEAVYDTVPWATRTEGPEVPTSSPYLDESWRWAERTKTPLVHYTSRQNVVYAILMAWPRNPVFLSHVTPTNGTTLSMLGLDRSLSWRRTDAGLEIEIPAIGVDEAPCRSAYVIRMENVAGR